MNNDTDTNSSIDINSHSKTIATQIFFYLFLLLDIPAVILSLLLFYYFVRLPELRQHQMIIYLLIDAFSFNAIDIPLILPYYQNLHYILWMKYPNIFCVFWIMYDYGMCSLNLWTMALFCFERYLLIFFKRTVMKTRRRRLILYYYSIAMICLLILCWYLYLVVFYPCSNAQFDYIQITCGVSCYEIEGTETVRNLDWILAGLVPVFFTVLFTVVLILHVLYQKHKMSKHLTHQETWKRTRKMFLQLLPITLAFLVCIMPMIIVGLLAVSDPWYGAMPYFYTNTLFYCLPLLIPFAVLSKQKVIQERLRTCLGLRSHNRTLPIVNAPLPMQPMNAEATRKINAKIISPPHL